MNFFKYVSVVVLENHCSEPSLCVDYKAVNVT